MISIVIPIYNQAEHLPNLLDSIKKQTYDNYEIIIINDGSTDELGKIIKQYKEIFGIKLNYFSQENKGANSARNYGARLAHGEYLIFCDADMIMEADMLAVMIRALADNPAAGFCYSSFYWGKKKFTLWPFDAEKLKTMPYINMASLLRREYFPGLDETLKKFMDWDLWLTMSAQGRGGVWLNQFLYRVSLSGRQTMSSWLPAFAYKLLPFLPVVKKYGQGMAIIKQKHNLK